MKQLIAILGLLAITAQALLAQATPQTVLTDEADTLITAGTAVGIAALGLFAAVLIFGTVKRFFNSGSGQRPPSDRGNYYYTFNERGRRNRD